MVRDAAAEQIRLLSLEKEVKVYETGCMGICAAGPVMLILPDRTFYTNLTPEKTRQIIKSHLNEQVILTEYTFYDHTLQKHIPKIDDISFFRDQVRIALRNCGIIEHSSIDAYIASNGYLAAARVLTQMTADDVIREIKTSGLRGRGGRCPDRAEMGFGRKAIGTEKYIVIDEGDPALRIGASLRSAYPDRR